jgi:hypothetical protein
MKIKSWDVILLGVLIILLLANVSAKIKNENKTEVKRHRPSPELLKSPVQVEF